MGLRRGGGRPEPSSAHTTYITQNVNTYTLRGRLGPIGLFRVYNNIIIINNNNK